MTTGGMGSVDNPVILDPFQTIVEVGWGTFEYIAFDIGLGFDNTRNITLNAADTLPSCVADPGNPAASPFNQPFCISRWVHTYGIGGFWKRRRGQNFWASGGGTVTVAGFRTSDQADFDDWSVMYNGAAPKYPYFRFTPISGSPVLDGNGDPVLVPETSDSFAAGGSLHSELMAVPLLGSPVCTTVGPTADSADWTDTGNYASYGNFSFDSLVAQLNGKNYPAIGFHTFDFHDFDGADGYPDINRPHLCFVLCQREDLIAGP